MNKSLFIIFSCIVSLLSFGLIFITGSILNYDVVKSARTAILNKSKKQLSKISESSRNDLLAGNLREARNRISSFEDSEIFYAFEIVKNGQVVDASKAAMPSESAQFLFIPTEIRFSTNGEIWGAVNYFVSTSEVLKLDKNLSQKLILSSLVTSVATFLLNILIFTLFWKGSSNLLNVFENEMLQSKYSIIANHWLLALAWKPLLAELKVFSNKFRVSELKNRENYLSLAKIEITRKVAHDIRSPLSALQVALASIEVDREVKEVLWSCAKRINDIADDLLNCRIEATLNAESSISDEPFFDICFAVKNIIEEKKISFPKVKFTTSVNETQVRGSCSEVQRILSNLINNSIEAAKIDTPLNIHLAAVVYADLCEVTIVDDGNGMHEDTLRAIGQEGFSFNKVDGNGLGIFSAKSYFQQQGEKFDVKSRIDVGTIVSFTLRTKI